MQTYSRPGRRSVTAVTNPPSAGQYSTRLAMSLLISVPELGSLASLPLLGLLFQKPGSEIHTNDARPQILSKGVYLFFQKSKRSPLVVAVIGFRPLRLRLALSDFFLGKSSLLVHGPRVRTGPAPESFFRKSSYRSKKPFSSSVPRRLQSTTSIDLSFVVERNSLRPSLSKIDGRFLFRRRQTT